MIVDVHRRTALIWLVTAGFVVLALLPAVIAFAEGWLRLPQVRGWGEQPAADATPPWAWALFALFYLAWMAGLGVLLVVCFDRLGHHWHPYDRPSRPRRKDQRRTRAALRAVTADEQAAAEALRRREEREARRRRDRERDEAWRRGPDGGGGGGR